MLNHRSPVLLRAAERAKVNFLSILTSLSQAKKYCRRSPCKHARGLKHARYVQ